MNFRGKEDLGKSLGLRWKRLDTRQTRQSAYSSYAPFVGPDLGLKGPSESASGLTRAGLRGSSSSLSEASGMPLDYWPRRAVEAGNRAPDLTQCLIALVL